VLALAVGVSLGDGDEPLNYVPIPGVCEFSGQMIARPVQLSAWLVRGTAQARADARIAAARGAMDDFNIIEYVPQTDEYIFEVPSGQDENGVANALMATGDFQYVEPNWIVYPIGCPNDPRFGQQWHHRADRMQSCDGWDTHTGEPTTSVGICDTGVRTTHEDLLLHRLEGYNAVDREWESQGGQINDINGHGTATTGCAAANGNNGVGVAGVGWDLSHRMLRVSNSSGGGSTLAILTHAVRTAIEHGDKVASVSYTGADNSTNLVTATYVKSIGGLLVWAAGNDNRNLNRNDRDDDDLIVAGGTNQSDNKAGFSAYGRFVDVVAPAVGVYTTSNSSNSSYGGATGTSFACPLTAGLCALIWSTEPSWTPDEVEYILKNGCDDLGDPGIDDIFGYGRINTFGSLELASITLDFFYPNGRPESVSPDGGTTLRVEVSSHDADPKPDTGVLHYDDGSGFVEVPMNHLGDNVYDAVFPQIECGLDVNYYVSVETTEGEVVTDPRDAPSDVYWAVSAVWIDVVFEDDFEWHKGWSVVNEGGLTAGAWDRVVPSQKGGQRGDPRKDFDGSGMCYVTGNGYQEDVDDGTTHLISRRINLSGGDATVRYARWYSNDFGPAPNNDTFMVAVSDNNGNDWTTAEVVGPAGPETGGGWFINSFKVSEFVSPTAEVRVRYSASDLGDDSVVEGGVDAFLVYRPMCSQEAITCDDIKKFKGKCRRGGKVKGKVILTDTGHSGQTVTIAIDGAPFELKVNGKKAKFNECCFQGLIVISLEDPPDCVDPIESTCP